MKTARIIINNNDVTVIAPDGGIAIIDVRDSELGNVEAIYYQTRIERFADPTVPLEITEQDWVDLSEGKAYHVDYEGDAVTHKMIHEAIEWLVCESRSDEQQNCYPYVEVQGNIIAELSSRNDWLNKELTAVTEQRDRLADLTKQFIKILDITEESDSGRLFHPTNITSCRAGDLQKIGELLEALRRSSNDL